MSAETRTPDIQHTDEDSRLTMAPLPYVVAAVHRETYDTVTLVLEPERVALPSWEPGQFTMIYAFGIGEIPISVSGDPVRQERLVHTVRDGSGGQLSAQLLRDLIVPALGAAAADMCLDAAALLDLGPFAA